uniref:Uncharacterized protein n=1 Tax=Ignavibacterium album TaxID=591197 RepID=A0A7V3E844_9BACT
MKKYRLSEQQNDRISPVKAIRKYCLECSCGSLKEVKNCVCSDCPLYPFRLGKNPNRKSIGNKNVAVRRVNSKIVS